MSALRWLRDIAAETARNPLVWAARPWRRRSSLAWFLLGTLGIGVAGTAGCWWLLAALGFGQKAWEQDLRLESLFACLVFQAAFLPFARDWRRGDRLVELSLTKLSPREIVLGSVFWGMAAGLIAVCAMHASLVIGLVTFVPERHGLVPVDPWRARRMGLTNVTPLGFVDTVLLVGLLGLPKLWPIWVHAFGVVVAWLAGGWWRQPVAALRGLAIALPLVVLVAGLGPSTLDVLGTETFPFSGQATFLSLPLLDTFLFVAGPLVLLGALSAAGPAAYFAGSQTAFSVGAGWRWLAREGKRDRERLHAAKRAIAPQVRAFWRDLWAAAAIGPLLVFCAATLLLARPWGSPWETITLLPLAAGVIAATAVTIWGRSRRGGRLCAAPALAGWSINRHGMPLLAVAICGGAMALFPTAIAVFTELEVERAFDDWAAPFGLALVVVAAWQWTMLVFLLGASRMRGAWTLALAWIPVILLAMASIALALAGGGGSRVGYYSWYRVAEPLWLMGMPIPQASSTILVQAGAIKPGAGWAWYLSTLAPFAALVLFALRHAGLHEILMQRFHDKELAGLGLYEVSGARKDGPDGRDGHDGPNQEGPPGAAA